MTDRKVAVNATVKAPAERIFALLTDPAKHSLLDGSGTVLAARGANPEKLELGSKFGMDMRLGLRYRITNRVVEYEENRLIAWRHVGGHRWRWELTPVDAETTEVTETFDWSTARGGFAYPLLGFPELNRKGMTATLARLADIV